jgi:hypothetical protein
VTADHTSAPPRPTGWVGWIAFTAIMMMMLGVFNVVDGIAALAADEIFVTGAAGSVFLDVTTWGWVHLVVGSVVATAGLFLFQGSTWARVVAIGALMLNMLTHLLFLPAYPVWSTLIIVLAVLALWALIVHGDERIA